MKIHRQYKPCRIKEFPALGRAVIYLNGKHGGIAICDLEDLDKVGKNSWVKNYRGYICRRAPRPGEGVEFMHRLVMGAKKGQLVDHVNRNTQDNRKSNLRFANQHSNSLNADKWGEDVGIRLRHGKWHVSIGVNQEYIWLGSFTDKAKARAARKAAELKYWKENKPRHKDDRVTLKGFK